MAKGMTREVITRLESASGLDKEAEETLTEYITRVGQKRDVSDDKTEAAIEVITQAAFSPSESDSLNSEAVSAFIDAIESFDPPTDTRKDSSTPPSSNSDNNDVRDDKLATSPSTQKSTESPASTDSKSALLTINRISAATSRGTTHDLTNIQARLPELPVLPYRYLKVLVAVLPALALVPLLDNPFGFYYYTGRAIAGYFQALAWLQLGLDSMTVATPMESLSSPVHLHSLLSAPLLALGVQSAGRVISLAAGVGASLGLGAVAAHFRGPRAGLLATSLYWIHPYTVRMSYVWHPDALSVFLTVTAVYFILRYDETERWPYWIASLGIACLAITVHFWEAIIGLPLVAVLFRRRDYILGGLTSAGIWGFVVIVHLASNYQPVIQGSLIEWFGVHNTGLEIFIQASWWKGSPSVAVNPVWYTSHVLILPLSIFMLGYCAFRIKRVRYYHNELPQFEILISTWILSGLTIPFLLPGGYLHHTYHIWGLVAPLLVSTAVIGSHLFEDTISVQTPSVSAIAIVALLCSSLYIIPFVHGSAPLGEDLPTEGEPPRAELEDAGNVLHERGVTNPERLSLVGKWPTNDNRFRGLVGILYSNAGIPIQYYGLNPDQHPSAQIVSNISDATREICVVRHGYGNFTVRNCPE